MQNHHHLSVRGAMALLAGLLLLCAAGRPAAAQSGAGLLLSPWEPDTSLELRSEALIQGSSHTRDGRDDSFQLRWYEASGRYRFNGTEQHPAVGFELDQLDLDTDHPMLPERLVDQSAAVGIGLAEWDGWRLGLTAGGGFAGDTPYSDEDAWYAVGNLILTRETGEDSGWQVLLNYNGNRTFLPDVPLPGVAYYRRVDETLSYTAGVPYSSVTWKPLAPLTVELNYTVPLTANLTAEWVLVEGVTLLGGFHNRFDAYHLDGTDEHRRLFFEQRRLEGGVRVEPVRWIDVTLAGGLAFDQELNRGYDARDLDNDLKIADAPYVRLGVDLRF